MFGRFLSSCLPCLTVLASVAQQVPDTYINKGSVTNQQVNARNFINEGTFAIASGTVPWNSLNTINFTNRGTITGSIGFAFDTVDPSDPLHGLFGLRHPASNFVNAANAEIVAFDGGGLLPFVNGTFASALFQPDVSFININAANVTNRGDITVGANGLMKLFGKTMDLTGGTLFVEDVNSTVSSSLNFGLAVTETNFFPSAGVYDLAAGVDLNTNSPVAGIVQSVSPYIIQTPTFNITNALGAAGLGLACQGINLLVNDAQVWLRDDRINSTNRVIQVIAVDHADSNVTVSASFYPFVFPGGAPQSGYLSSLVELRYAFTNFRTLDLTTNSLYVFDQLGSHTNYGLSQNIAAGSFRPSGIILFRGAAGLGDSGIPGLPFIDPDVFDNPAYSNRIVTNQYAVYSAEVQSIASRLPALPDVGITNAAGRVELYADKLKLSNTRIRAEGLITISATNLVGGEGTVLDVPHLNMNLATRTDSLDVKDMTPDSVQRFGGFLQVYSGIWTNVYSEINGTGTNAVTNAVETHFGLVVVHSAEHATEPVVAHELRLTSTNSPNGSVVYEDNLTVSNLVQINAKSLTLAEGSRLYLAKGVGLSYTNLLNISTFTNLGQIQANELAELRTSESKPFDSFVNRGSIVAFGTDVNANYFENTGDIISSNNYTYVFGSANSLNTDCFGVPSVFSFDSETAGPISVTANTAKIDGGRFATLGDVRFSGKIFKINHHGAEVQGRMSFDVTDILTDSGEVQDNTWVVHNGFEMTPVHPLGDLLGTEIRSFASRLSFVDHIWSSVDRGATNTGFIDNSAIGRLRLEGDVNSVFQFVPAGENSAIYLDVLEIQGLQASSIRDFTNRVKLQMNVYYGNIESTNFNLTAERLNKVLGPDAPFNFYWVTNWAGPNSGVDVPLTENGPVVRMNRALRESPNIDSDGDGLPNLYDQFPLTPDPLQITSASVNISQADLSIKFNAQSNAKYVIESTTNLSAPDWQPITGILQTSPSGGIMSITDQVRAGAPQRYYRVRKAP